MSTTTEGADLGDTNQLVAETSLHWSDLLVIVVYFAIVLFIGLWVSSVNSKQG